MKRWIALVLSCLLLIGMLPISAAAAETLTDGDWNYEITDDAATITGYTGSAKELVIPTTLGGYTVTAIGDNAFEGRLSINRVTFSEGITAIGTSAFNGCKKIWRVDFPKSLTFVGKDAFKNCSELTGVYIIDLASWCGISFVNEYSNPLSIANNLYRTDNHYEHETLLTKITLPESVTRIGAYAFYNYKRLTQLDASASALESIGGYAFSGCTGLTSIGTLPESLTAIGDSAFAGCTGLTLVEIPLSSQPQLIGKNAFSGCSGLQEVFIPSSVKGIGDSAFSSCKIGVVKTTDLASWCAIVFGNETANPLNGASSMFVGTVPINDLAIPDEITTIENYAFYGFEGLRCVMLSENAKIVRRSTFTKCKNLEYVLVPEGMNTLGENAFDNCASLKDVYFTGKEDRWTTVPNYQQFMKSGITVHYEAEKIAITFLADNGTAESTVTPAISGRPYVLSVPAFTAPENQQFKKWQIGEQQYAPSASFTPYEDTTATAIWGGIEYVITFDKNGGAGSMESVTVDKGDPRELPYCAFTAPTGKQFAGWQVGDAVKNPGDSIPVTADMTIKAVWIGLYAVTFDGNGNKGGSMSPTTATINWVLPACKFTPQTGYRFKEWKVEWTENETPHCVYDVAEKPITIGGNVKLTAIWEVIPCSVTLVLLDGAVESADAGTYFEYTLPECTDPLPDMTFKAWNVGGTEYQPGAVIQPKTDSLTVKAVWNSDYDVVFKDGGITVKKYNGTEADLVIPGTLAGYPVTAIANSAFSYNTTLKTVTVPDSVTTIGPSAFLRCTGLTSVTLGQGMKTIGNDAFNTCSKLTQVTLCSELTTVGQRAFSGCNLLKDVYFKGTPAEWDAVTIGSTNDPLTQATVHFTGDGHDHSYDSGVITTPATCETDGVKTFTCTDCHETYTEVIPATGHAWSEEKIVVREPTIAEMGVRAIVCENCGAQKDEEEFRYTIADVNHDGVVNGKDVTILRRFLAGGYGVTLD